MEAGDIVNMSFIDTRQTERKIDKPHAVNREDGVIIESATEVLILAQQENTPNFSEQHKDDSESCK
jgi:hypothetical protein